MVAGAPEPLQSPQERDSLFAPLAVLLPATEKSLPDLDGFKDWLATAKAGSAICYASGVVQLGRALINRHHQLNRGGGGQCLAAPSSTVCFGL